MALLSSIARHFPCFKSHLQSPQINEKPSPPCAAFVNDTLQDSSETSISFCQKMKEYAKPFWDCLKQLFCCFRRSSSEKKSFVDDEKNIEESSQEEQEEELLDDWRHLFTQDQLRSWERKWFHEGHICHYGSLLCEKYPQLASMQDIYGPCVINKTDVREIFIDARVEADFAANEAGKTIFAYPFMVSQNHWTLILIDRERRTVEYYDSKKNYGNHAEIVAYFNQFVVRLTSWDPGVPYQFIPKIKIKLQPDTFQCGPWTTYFLEERLKNPDFDFNSLDIAQSQKTIAEYRMKILSRLCRLACHSTTYWVIY